MPCTLAVTDHGRKLFFNPEDLLRYHGPGSPAGVALAFQPSTTAAAPEPWWVTIVAKMATPIEEPR